MQEVREEMTKRVVVLGNQVAHREEEIADHRTQIERLSGEIEDLRTLETQYRKVLDGLPKP